jgi:hypothetical protein
VSPTEILPALASEGALCFLCGAPAKVKMVVSANDARCGAQTQPSSGWHLCYRRQVDLCGACVELAARDHRPLEAALEKDLVAAGLAELT